MKVKRLLTATAIAASLLTSAAHADSPASDFGYATAALEKVCPGLTVTDPKLRAKLDKKYRNTADFKDGYEWVAKRIDDASKKNEAITNYTYHYVTLTTCINPAVTEAKWLHQDPEILEGLEARVKRNEELEAQYSSVDKLKAAIEYYNSHPFEER